MRFLYAAFAALVLVLPTAAAAQFAPGTKVSGTVQQTIDTKNSNVGDAVTLINVTSSDGKGEVVGARMDGAVTKIVRAGQGRNAQLQMTFTTLRLADGTTYTVDGVVTGMQSKKKSNLAKEAAGAVGGMLAGNAIGKTLGLGAGGLIGAVGGFLIMKNSKENMAVPAGALVDVQLQSARRQAQ